MGDTPTLAASIKITPYLPPSPSRPPPFFLSIHWGFFVEIFSGISHFCFLMESSRQQLKWNNSQRNCSIVGTIRGDDDSPPLRRQKSLVTFDSKKMEQIVLFRPSDSPIAMSITAAAAGSSSSFTAASSSTSTTPSPLPSPPPPKKKNLDHPCSWIERWSIQSANIGSSFVEWDSKVKSGGGGVVMWCGVVV